jgi:hypothetical protein
MVSVGTRVRHGECGVGSESLIRHTATRQLMVYLLGMKPSGYSKLCLAVLCCAAVMLCYTVLLYSAVR